MFFKTDHSVQHAVGEYSHISKLLHLIVGEWFDEMGTLIEDHEPRVQTELVKLIHVEGMVLLKPYLPVGNDVNVRDEAHLHGKQPMEGPCVGDAEVNRRLWCADGLECFQENGWVWKFMEQGGRNDEIEGLSFQQPG